ncbi:uncharacterized protein [Canis lupus baileyi]|uniref:uncharacterized protein LOC112643403 isoform X4 n=1 Tax=Canis lupus dingo TaxID=286419 RepID=UPI0015F12A3D|nr:uncharacterized protein LOC112643403 isoform X4 [Canis lupus dingo]
MQAGEGGVAWRGEVGVQTRSVLRVLSPEGQEYAAECLESISVLPVPQPHTGRPLPGETTVPAATATGGDSGTMNPSRHRHKSPGRMGLCRTPRSQRRTHTKCRGQRPALLRLETDGDAHPASHRDVRMYLGCRRGRGYFRARSDPHTSAMEEEETAFSGIERMHTLLHNYHHHPFPGLFPSSKLCLAIDGQEQPPTNPILSSSEKGQRKDEANGRGERAQFLKAILEGNWTDNSLLGPTRPQLDRGEIISHIYSQPICITGAKTHTREKIVSLINGAG